MNTAKIITELLKQKESQNLEFKESFGRETIETITAFSNTSGGIIIIGISEKRKVTGIHAGEENVKNWINAIKQSTQPQIYPEINLTEAENKTIAIINVQEYPIKPVSCKGKYYKRIGASNHDIPVNEIVEMQLYSINSSFDSYTVEVKYENLHTKLINKFFEQLSNAGRIKLQSDPILNMKQIGLIKKNKITFAALLLFGEHKTNIHIGRFKTPDLIIDDILIKEPLVTAVDDAMNFIKKNISIRYDINGQLRRKEIWQYPLPAIRELLLNSIIHKDYRNPTDIIIKIFDDKIIFINPGSLLYGLKPKDLLEGDYLAIHRNKLLAESFYLRGDIEKFGTGFYRIRRELLNYSDLKFDLESHSGFTKASLEFESQGTPQDTPQEALQDSLQEEKQFTSQIEKLVKNLESEMSRDELQQKLGLRDRSNFIKLYLKPALKYDYIEMTIPEKPNSKFQKYRLTDKGNKAKIKLFTK